MSSYFPVHLYSSHFFFNFDVLKVTVLLPNVVKKKKLFFPGNKNFEEKRNRTVKNTLRKFIRKYNTNFSCSKREKEIARLLSKRNNRIRNHLSRARSLVIGSLPSLPPNHHHQRPPFERGDVALT